MQVIPNIVPNHPIFAPTSRSSHYVEYVCRTSISSDMPLRTQQRHGSLTHLTVPGSVYISNCRCCTNWDARWRMRWQSQQHGLERYNCADSLDRTNAASYFGAVQVFAYPCCCSFTVVGCGELPDLPSQRCMVAGVCLKPTASWVLLT